MYSFWAVKKFRIFIVVRIEHLHCLLRLSIFPSPLKPRSSPTVSPAILPSANPAAWSHVFKTETDLVIDIKCKTKYRFSSFAHIQTTTCGAMVHFRTKAILWIAPDWRQALRGFLFLESLRVEFLEACFDKMMNST
jgi:hypothetical protein